MLFYYFHASSFFSNFVTCSSYLVFFLFIRTNSSFKQNVLFLIFHIRSLSILFHFVFSAQRKLRLCPTLRHFRYISMFLTLMNKEENERKNDKKRWKQMFSYKLIWCRVAVVCSFLYLCVFFFAYFIRTSNIESNRLLNCWILKEYVTLFYNAFFMGFNEGARTNGNL